VEEKVASGETLPYRFTSKEYDPETGLYYFGHRYHNPQTGLWGSVDPPLVRGEYFPKPNDMDTDHDYYWYGANDQNSKLPGMGGVFNPVNLNVYHYAGLNPVKLLDPDGNQQIISNWFWKQAGITQWSLRQYFIERPQQPIIDLKSFSSRAHQLRTWGHQQFPGEKNSDARHYSTSYVLTREFLKPNLVDKAGIVNEVQGLLMHDIPDLKGRLEGTRPWACQIADIKANRQGIQDAIRDIKLLKEGKNAIGPKYEIKNLPEKNEIPTWRGR